MKKLICLFVLSALSLFTFGQSGTLNIPAIVTPIPNTIQGTFMIDVPDLTFSLEDLGAKRVKSNADVVVSDHTFDGRGATKTGYEIVITGTGTRGLVFKNFHGASKEDPVKIIFRGTKFNMTGSGVVIKMAENNWHTSLICEGCEIKALPGGSASQVIYYIGDFIKGARIEGFTIDQGRPDKTMETSGGAAIQLAGSYSASCNASNWKGYEYIDLINNTVKNANDEIYYVGHNNVTDGYGPVSTGAVTIDGLVGDGSGRECIQVTYADTLRIKNAKCSRASLEKDGLHWSSLSLNDKNKYVLVEDSFFEGAAQPVYSGALKHAGQAVFKNCTFIQRMDYTAPSALYLKGNANYSHTFVNCTIVAKAIAITTDSGPVKLIGETNTISSPTLMRPFNGTLAFIPEFTTNNKAETIQVQTTTTWEGTTSTKYYLNGVELRP
jgi:hypothetical protein